MAVAGVVRHFDQMAGSYGQLRGAGPLGALRRKEQAAFRSLVSPQAGERVLDAGCGDGETLSWLAERRARAVGIDVSARMAAGCGERGFVTSIQDMEHTGFAQCFDWVLCVGALEFTADPTRAIASLARCLRRGGRFALLFPRRSLVGAAYLLYHRSHGVNVHLFTPRLVARTFLAVGLHPVADAHGGALSSVIVAENRR